MQVYKRNPVKLENKTQYVPMIQIVNAINLYYELGQHD